MEFPSLKYWLRSRFSRKQKAALAGKIPMTRELFWSCLDVVHSRLDRKAFREIWSRYPQYVQEFHEGCKNELPGDNPPDGEWKELRSKLAKEFGEAWVKAHFKD